MSHQQSDPFFLVFPVHHFDELVAQGGFIQDVLDPQHHLEPDAVVSQLVIPDQGLEAGDPVFALFQHVLGHAQGHIFHLLEVIAIGHRNGDGDGAFRQRLLVVGQVASSDVLVGDDDHVPGGGPDGSIPPVHIHHSAGFPAGQFDVVPHPHLFGKDGGDAGKQVGQGILEGQGGSQPASAQSGQKGRNGNTVGIQDEQEPHHVYPDIHHRGQDGHGGRPFLAFGQPGFQIGRNEMGRKQGDGEDHQAVEVHIQSVADKGRQIQDVLGEAAPQHHPQKHRQEPEGALPGLFAAPSMFGEKGDEALEHIMEEDDPHDVEQDEGHHMHMGPPVLEFLHQHFPSKISGQNHPLLYNSFNK